MGRMKLLIDGRAAQQRVVTGVQRYARDIAAWLERLGVDFELAVPPPGARLRKHLWEQDKLLRIARRYDVLFCPANLAPIRPIRPARLAVTLHSVAFAHDAIGYTPAFRWYYRWMIPRVIGRADAVIAVSHAERDRIAALYPSAAGKITVVHHGLDRAFGPVGGRAERPYVLFVGSLSAGKSPETAMAALGRIAGSVPHRFALAGATGGPFLELAAGLRAAAGGLSPERVDFLGSITDTARLVRVYSRADALVLPSRYESFGLPVLEAMACGTAVIASDLPALREVAGPAAVYVRPGDVDGWAAAMRSVLGDPARRADLRQRGLERAKAFGWRQCAQRTLAVLERAARA